MIKKWTVEYLDEAKLNKWFKSLGSEKFQALYEEILLLAELGNEIAMPHSKSLGKGLFELRERSFGLRIYYTFRENKVILLLHGGDKGSQQEDIKKSQKILKSL